MARPGYFDARSASFRATAPAGDSLPWPGVLAWRDDSVGASVSDRVMALAGITGAVSGDAADLLVGRDLVEQLGQDRCITDMAPGDPDSADLQCFFVNPEVDLAPDTPFGAAMFTSVPLAFAVDLDPSAVNQQVQWPPGPAIWDVHGECLPATGQRAEVRDRPVGTGQTRQAFDEAGRLPKGHAEQNLH